MAVLDTSFDNTLGDSRYSAIPLRAFLAAGRPARHQEQ
jgi:hypothetical protein